MIQLILLGIIGLGAAFAWVYFSKLPKKVKPAKPDQEEGKIIYLFPDSSEEKDEKKNDDSEPSSANPDDDMSHADDDKDKDGD